MSLYPLVIEGEKTVKKKSIIVLLSIAVLVVATVVGLLIYNNHPKVVARNAIINVLLDFCKREEIEPVLKMLDGGSLELDADVKMAFLGSLKASGKIYFADDEVMISNLKAMAGELEISADAYFGEDLSYVTNDDLLGGSYGMIRGEMVSSFQNNSFWRDQLLSDDQERELCDRLEYYDSGKDKDFEKDLKKYTQKYLKLLVKTVEKNAVYSSETVEEGELRAVYISISEEGMLEIAKTLYDELKNDSKLREDLCDYLGKDTSAYDEMLDGLNKYVEGGGKALHVKIITPKHSATLLSLEARGESGSAFTIDTYGLGIKNTNKITVTVGENSVMEMSVNKEDNTFKLSSSSPRLEITGELVKDGETMTVTPTYIRIGDISLKKPRISLVINEKDKMPEPLKREDVKTIFEIPSDKLENVLHKLGIEVNS